MAILPISTVVEINVSQTPAQLGVQNVNNLAIFTDEKPLGNSTNGFRVYANASAVGLDFGTDSQIFNLASLLFSQSPNLRSSGATLAIFPEDVVGATRGTFSTAVISADNISAILQVSDGSLGIQLDGGQTVQIEGLNFTTVQQQDIGGIVDVLNGKFGPMGVLATSANGAIILSSPSFGSSSSLRLSAGTGGTDLSGSQYLNVESGESAPGENASGTTVAEMVTAAEELFSFTGFTTTFNLEADAIRAGATAIQPTDHIWMLGLSGPFALSVADTIVKSSLTHTRCLYYGNHDSIAATEFATAYMGRAFSVNFSGSQTVQTMHLKTLAGILPDGTMTSQLLEKINAAGMDAYCSFGGLPKTFSSGTNLFFDEVYSQIALKRYLQTALFNALAATSTKIPQTEAGMDTIKAAAYRILNLFVRNGFCSPGQWNSPDTFGDPEIFRQNILERGYYVYSLPISLQDQSEREKRIAPLIQIAIKESGAIHHLICNIYVEA